MSASYNKTPWTAEQRKSWWALPTETRKEYWNSVSNLPQDSELSDPYSSIPNVSYETFQSWQTKKAENTPELIAKRKLQAQVANEKAMAGYSSHKGAYILTGPGGAPVTGGMTSSQVARGIL